MNDQIRTAISELDDIETEFEGDSPRTHLLSDEISRQERMLFKIASMAYGRYPFDHMEDAEEVIEYFREEVEIEDQQHDIDAC